MKIKNIKVSLQGIGTYSNIDIKLSQEDQEELELIAANHKITLNQLLSDTLASVIIDTQEKTIIKLKKQVFKLKLRLRSYHED